ncbi:MAG: hypothetical protein IJ787_07360 [Bacilli bacterium]|nr:hypothetical protein [Bacilli bacterium]
MATNQFHFSKEIGNLHKGVLGLKRLFLSRVQGLGAKSAEDDADEKPLPVIVMQYDLVEFEKESPPGLQRFEKQVGQCGFQIRARGLFQTNGHEADRGMLGKEIETRSRAVMVPQKILSMVGLSPPC